MSAFADLVRFLPVAGGTTDWVVSSAVGGCQLPSAANVLNGVSYKLYAVSTDLTQWEVVISVYNSGTTTFPRTTVLYNSSGTGTATGQSGAGTKINFSTIPQVSIIAIAEDLIQIETANNFTTTQRQQARTNISAVLKGQYFGLTLSTAGSSATFSVGAGEAADSTGVDLMALAASINKTTAAWAVGNNNGSFDGTGNAPTANAEWVHVHLIKRPDTGVVDVLTSLSTTAPTLPTNYTTFRRIGSIQTNGSFQWILFKQIATTFYWNDAVHHDQTSASLAASTPTNFALASIPPGIAVRPIVIVESTSTATNNNRVRVYSPSLADTNNNNQVNIGNADSLATTSDISYGEINQHYSDTSQHLRFFTGDTGVTLDIYTMGWIDDMGRYG